MARTTEKHHVTLQDGRVIEVRLRDNGQVRIAATTQQGRRVFLTVLGGEEGARISYPYHRTALSWHQPNAGGGTTTIVTPVDAIADWPEAAYA